MILDRALHRLKRCYEFSYLQARHRAGSLLSRAESRRLGSLSEVFVEAMPGDRAHRRLAMMLPVELEGSGDRWGATLLNLSVGGMFVASPRWLELGQRLRLYVGEPGQTRYVFSAEVVRAEGEGAYGLRLLGVPIELRYGSYHRRSLLRPAA